MKRIFVFSFRSCSPQLCFFPDAAETHLPLPQALRPPLPQALRPPRKPHPHRPSRKPHRILGPTPPTLLLTQQQVSQNKMLRRSRLPNRNRRPNQNPLIKFVSTAASSNQAAAKRPVPATLPSTERSLLAVRRPLITMRPTSL